MRQGDLRSVVAAEQAGPNLFAALLAILVKPAAVVTPAAAFVHQGVDDAARHRAIAPLIENAHIGPGCPGFARQFQADFIVNL